ncbi:MAG: hypothetical protein RL307_1200 [Pseudomonadota bacterium]|jgi:TRAP-type C4-dicarboxylate transport system substrate-binding protein
MQRTGVSQFSSKFGASEFDTGRHWSEPFQTLISEFKLFRSLSLGVSLLTWALLSWAGGVTVLKASHQFPGGQGDVRDEMMQLMAREVKAADVNLDIKIHPNGSLIKPLEQWKYLVQGQIDMTLLPLDYASGAHPEFGVTLLPGLVRNHDHAQRMNQSAFMKDIRTIIQKGGATVLADAWLAGGMGSKDRCLLEPKDAKGLKVRSAGTHFAKMWAGAGATPLMMPSSEIHAAFQRGSIQAVDTSSGSFVSFKLNEHIKCLTAPGEETLWFMYQPVLISNKAMAQLNEAQRKALMAAGKKAEAYFDRESRKLDTTLIETFRQHNVKIVSLSRTQADQWRAIARETSYKEFASKVPGGQVLIEKALSVQ